MGLQPLIVLFLVPIPILRTRLRLIGRAGTRFQRVDQWQSLLFQLLVQFQNVFRLNLAPSRQLLFERFIQFVEYRGLLRRRRSIRRIETAEQSIETTVSRTKLRPSGVLK